VIGRLAADTSEAKCSRSRGDARSVVQSSVAARCRSASAQRRTVGPTDPRDTPTDEWALSRTTHTLATAITMALRTPTLAYPCHPSTTGTVIDTISSPGWRAVRLTPVMNSPTGTLRRPDADANSTIASSALSTGRPSPAGEHVPRLPPSVPTLRIWGEPTVRDACASAGTRSASGPVASSV
jgi:hypothetical protein